MYSPNHLWFSSQLYIVEELLQKQAADAKRKGVVGKIGRTTPIAPKTRQIMPAMSHKALATFCPFFFSSANSQTVLSCIVQHPRLIPASSALRIPFDQIARELGCKLGTTLIKLNERKYPKLSLLQQRHEKLDKDLELTLAKDLKETKRLFSEIFNSFAGKLEIPELQSNFLAHGNDQQNEN